MQARVSVEPFVSDETLQRFDLADDANDLLLQHKSDKWIMSSLLQWMVSTQFIRLL